MRSRTLAITFALSVLPAVAVAQAAAYPPPAPAAPAAAQPAKTPPLTAAEEAKYTGVYALMLPNGARDFTFAAEGDHLTGQLAGQPAFPMIYLGNDTFGVSFDPNLRITFTVEKGRATKVGLDQNGGHFEGAKK